jgi:prepilin-type processing-associated H-X9-DG protein
MLLPPLYKLMPHFAPAGGVTWVDDAGWHAKAISPFPGSMVLGNNQTAVGIAGPAMMISVLAPALNKARDSANHVKSTSNLRQIGLGCIMYANEHNGAFPPDLGSLVKTQDLAVDTFVSPQGQGQVPADLRGQKAEDQAAWVNQNADYVYLGAGKNLTIGADTAIAYEKSGTGKDGTTNVVFADGHVEAVGPDKLGQLVPGGGGNK